MKTTGIINKTKALATRKKKELYAAAVALSVAVIGNEMMMPPVMASGFTDKIKSGMDSITDAIVTIGTPLYAMIAAVCIIIMIAASGQKVQQAKDWLVRATIGYVALLSLSAITAFVEGLV